MALGVLLWRYKLAFAQLLARAATELAVTMTVREALVRSQTGAGFDSWLVKVGSSPAPRSIFQNGELEQ